MNPITIEEKKPPKPKLDLNQRIDLNSIYRGAAFRLIRGSRGDFSFLLNHLFVFDPVITSWELPIWNFDA